jgi:hypothetical protein
MKKGFEGAAAYRPLEHLMKQEWKIRLKISFAQVRNEIGS